MTVTAATTRNDYTATSGQTVFAYTFTALAESDIVVLKNGTTLTLGGSNDYTLSGIGSYGGNVTLVVGATTGDVISIYLDMPIARTTNYQNSGDFLALDVNGDFDKLYIALQEEQTNGQRSIRRPLADINTISMELPKATDRAGKLAGFTSTGAVEAVAYSGANSTFTVLNIDTFTGNGSTTAFTLTDTITAKEFLQISIDGVMQAVATYSVSGTTLTFTEAPPLNSGIEVRKFIGNVTTLEGISGVTAGTNLNGGGTSGNVTVNVDTAPSFTQVDITAQGDLRLQDSSGGQYAALQAAATTTSYTLTLPAAVGSSGQVLQTTDGSGTLGFATVGGAYNEWAVKTTTYQLVHKDQIICNHASTPFTVTLPTANVAGGNVGNTVIIKNVGAATVTIARNSSPIDSVAADGTLPTGNAVQMVYTDDTIGWATL
tara:strand:+ start:16331 stop:17623 length:1293 start_codon:yes stop_codon:yes gene_type:complete